MSQVVPDNLVRDALASGDFETETVRVQDLSAGQFDGVSLNEDTQGVIGTLEVGNDDPVADAAAVIVGEYMGADPRLPPQVDPGSAQEGFVSGQTDQGRLDLLIQEATPGDPAQDPMVLIAGGAQESFTDERLMSPRPWDLITTTEVSSVTDIQPIRPGGKPKVVKAGRHVNLAVKPTTGAETYSLSDSTGYFPILKWVP